MMIQDSTLNIDASSTVNRSVENVGFVSYSTSNMLPTSSGNQEGGASLDRSSSVSSAVPILQTGEVLTEFERDIIHTLVIETLPTVLPSELKTIKYLRLLHRQVFDVPYRKALAQEGRLSQLRRILYACVVRQVILNESIPLPEYEELQTMPFFTNPDLLPKTVSEIRSLLHFLRVMKTLKDIGLPGVNNKLNYIEVGAMMDGSQRSYSLGGAPSKATMRRVVIFHAVSKELLHLHPHKKSGSVDDESTIDGSKRLLRVDVSTDTKKDGVDYYDHITKKRRKFSALSNSSNEINLIDI
jgi:hypothetical protein